MKISTRGRRIFLALRKFFLEYAWWEIALFVIGAISFISIIMIFLLPVGSGPLDFTYSGTVPDVSTLQFTHMLSQSLNLPLEKGNPIKVYDNGDQFLPAFLADIDSAHTSIDIMTYIWTDGSMSDQVLDHLDQKLKEGVQVRIMIDGIGSATNKPDKAFKTFQELGGKLAIYDSFTMAPWDFIKNESRNHRRAMVIDGNIGYTGGMAISDVWLGNASNPDQYRDTMFRSTGPMAQTIQGMFSELWASVTGEVLIGNDYFPSSSTAVQSNTSSLTYIPLASTPSPDSLALQKFILLSILGAQKEIYITTPYFLPDASFREALIAKAKAGVDVRILVPGPHIDTPSVRYASQYFYDDLLKGGVKIYEYQPTFIHTKTIVIDGDWSIIGSANMDNRSRNLNEEDIIGVSDKTLGANLQSTFLTDLTNAQQIDLAQWDKRSLWQRIREVFDQKFVQQY